MEDKIISKEEQAGSGEETYQEETFLRRWSRRKLEDKGRVEGHGDETPPPASEIMQAATVTEADLPSLEDLDAHSDFSRFMSPRISEELRRLALRKLFHMPQYQKRCLLNEYEGNFNDFKPLDDAAIRAGRRLLKREAERMLVVDEEQPLVEQGMAVATEASPDTGQGKLNGPVADDTEQTIPPKDRS